MATNSNRPDDRRHISSPSLMPSVTAERPAFLAPLSARVPPQAIISAIICNLFQMFFLAKKQARTTPTPPEITSTLPVAGSGWEGCKLRPLPRRSMRVAVEGCAHGELDRIYAEVAKLQVCRVPSAWSQTPWAAGHPHCRVLASSGGVHWSL